MRDPVASGPPETVPVRAVVAYDGTDYAGFQVQRSRATVQGDIERALERLSQGPVRIAAGGRTDAGVHAAGQVISFRVAWRHPLPELLSGLNALLPRAIAVQELGQAPEGFHARHSARSRHYRYTVLVRPIRAPLTERYACRIGQPLDLDAMREAAARLVGEQDFCALGDPAYGSNHVRTVFRAEWSQCGDVLTFDIVANAFLRGMVRRAVGAMLRVGANAMSVNGFAEALTQRDRKAMGAPADPCGLCLMAVSYGSVETPRPAAELYKELSGENIRSQSR